MCYHRTKISPDAFVNSYGDTDPQELKDRYRPIFILGYLCQWKSEIFRAFEDQKSQSDWLKLACTIYNYFWSDFPASIFRSNLIHQVYHTLIKGSRLFVQLVRSALEMTCPLGLKPGYSFASFFPFIGFFFSKSGTLQTPGFLPV